MMEIQMDTQNAAALRYLIEDVSKPSFATVHETAREKQMLISLGNGKSEIKAFEKDRPGESHQHHTLAGLLTYLRDVHAKTELRAVIFVGEGKIYADLDYQGPLQDELTLVLEHSPEYRALEKLAQGVGQKDLWKRLVNELYGTFDHELLTNISSLKLNQRQESAIQIDPSGLIRASEQVYHEIVFPKANGEGMDSKEIGLDWTFQIPIFECFDHKAPVETRLELDNTGRGLFFAFNPRRLERTLAAERLALTGWLREECKDLNVVVVEGEN